MTTYQKDRCAYFHRVKDTFGGLSNFAAYPLVVNDRVFATSEALYQACRFPHLPEVQEEIRAAKNPYVAKLKSREYMDQTREDWSTINVRVMRWCLRVKLAQHYRVFGSLLLSTGELPIVEYSTRSAFWGAMPAGDLLIGDNVLGKLLTELRQLMLADRRLVKYALPPYIPTFDMFGRPVSVIKTPESLYF